MEEIYSKVITAVMLVVMVAGVEVSVSSESVFVGALTTYKVIFTQHNYPHTLQTVFSQWSPNEAEPFENYEFRMEDGSTDIVLDCGLKFSRTVIECQLNDVGDTISISMKNVHNPSSTKPYQIDFTLIGTTNTESITASLTVSQMSSSQLVLNNYSPEVDAKSDVEVHMLGVQIYIQFLSYLTEDTVLQLSYDSSKISLLFSPDATSGYSVMEQGEGSVTLTQWRNLALGTQILPDVSVHNVDAGLSYVLTGHLFYVQNNVTYDIQSYSFQQTLTPISFTTLTATTSLPYAQLSQIHVTQAACPSVHSSYIIITIPSVLSVECSNSTSFTGGTNCSYESTDITIDNVIADIVDMDVSLEVRQYNYHEGTQSYWPVCQGQLTVQLVQQVVDGVEVDLGSCGQVAGERNVVDLMVEVEGWEVGHVVRIKGLKGEIVNGWTESGESFVYTLTSSNTFSPTHIQIPLTYSNPTYITTNTITSLTIQSDSLIYATYSQQTPLCEVTTPATIPSLNITIQHPNTYHQSSYNISIKTSFSDYTNTSIMISFDNNQHALTGEIVCLVDDALVGYVIEGTTMEISDVLVQGKRDYSLTIQNVINPPNECSNCSITVQLLSQTLSIKQTRTSSVGYTISGYTIATMSMIGILSTTILSIHLENTYRPLYQTHLSSTVRINTPFPCNNNTQNEVEWQRNIDTLDVVLNNCQVGFLLSGVVDVEEFTLSQQSIQSLINIQLLCPQNCFECVNSYCTQCVNQTHSTLIHLYDGVCYEKCPAGTYLPTEQTTCAQCHISCQTCETGPTITDCLTCHSHFIKQVSGMCISECGSKMYYNEQLEQCVSCHANCEHCLNGTYCYECISLGEFVGEGYCQLMDCEVGCAECEGEITNCIQCDEQLFLYGAECYQQCPQSTYSDASTLTCIQFSAPLLYLPMVSCSVVLFIVACLCKCCEKKASKTIYLLTYTSVMLSYMEICCIVIILVFSMSENRVMGFVGAGLWILANLLFGIYYCARVAVRAHRVLDKMTDKGKCIYYAIIVLCMGVSLRTYRVLYSGLFRGVAVYLVHPQVKDTASEGQNRSPKAEESNKEVSEGESEVSSSDPETVLLLNQPFINFVTIISLVASVLFLITGIRELMDQLYVNMFFWGLDMTIVGSCSIISMVSEMWVGVKKKQLEKKEGSAQENNQTLENMNQYIQEDKIGEPEKQYVEVLQQSEHKIVPQMKTIESEETKRQNPLKRKFNNRHSRSRNKKTLEELSKQKNKNSTIQPEKTSAPIINLNKTEKIKIQPKRYQLFLDQFPDEPEQEDQADQIPNIKVFDDLNLQPQIPQSKSEKKGKNIKMNKTQRATSHLRQTYKQTTRGTKNKQKQKPDDIFVGFSETSNENQTKTVTKGGKNQKKKEQESISDSQSLQ